MGYSVAALVEDIKALALHRPTDTELFRELSALFPITVDARGQLWIDPSGGGALTRVPLSWDARQVAWLRKVVARKHSTARKLARIIKKYRLYEARRLVLEYLSPEVRQDIAQLHIAMRAIEDGYGMLGKGTSRETQRQLGPAKQHLRKGIEGIAKLVRRHTVE